MLSIYPTTILTTLISLVGLFLFFTQTSCAQEQQHVLHQSHSEEDDAPINEIEAALHHYDIRIQIQNISPLMSPRPPIDCQTTCDTLSVLFPDLLISRDARSGEEQEAYSNFTRSYWSNQQADLSPSCVFSPRHDADVAVYLLVSRLTQCPFSVRGGGHASFAGASSIDDGTVLALRHLDEIEITTDGAALINPEGLPDGHAKSSPVVRVGAGNRWGDVYRALEETNSNLTVVGGRDADVGVSGLLLGGGLSYFSNLYGFACDNVLAFEVVLASGRVVVARPGPEQEYADLYWALRGGGNNFGVVTAFYLAAFPLPRGLIWGGAMNVQDEEAFSPLIGAFYHMATGTSPEAGDHEVHVIPPSSDPDTIGHIDKRASQILAFAQINGSLIASVQLQYTQPFETLPPVFTEYMSILSHTRQLPKAVGPFDDHVHESHSRPFTNRSLVDLTELLSRGQPPGRRNMYRTATFKLRRFVAEYAAEMFDLLLRTSPDTRTIANLFPALLLQPISTVVLQNTRTKGGNPLGLEGEEPRLVITIVLSWSDSADDEKVALMARRFIDRMTEIADDELCDCRDDYVYMNYASQDQQVLSSYGDGNLDRLRRIARQYDPHQVFQRLLPGYHKL